MTPWRAARPLLPWILGGLRVCLGLFFIYAGADKLADPLAFAEKIAEYDVTSIEVSSVAARFLPLLEILAGLSLLTNYLVLGGALLTGLLNGFFAIMVAIAYARGLNIDCGCFTGSGKTTPWHVVFNLSLCGLCAAIYRNAALPGAQALQAPGPPVETRKN